MWSSDSPQSRLLFFRGLVLVSLLFSISIAVMPIDHLVLRCRLTPGEFDGRILPLAGLGAMRMEGARLS